MSAHDVFICYSSKDEEQAFKVVRFLEERQVRCWIACRDVRPGANYQESIVEALRAARALVFLFSDASNKTAEVKKELSLASSFGTAVIPFRMTMTLPNGALQYELATRQWIDAVGDADAALDKLFVSVRDVLRESAHGAEPADATPLADRPSSPRRLPDPRAAAARAPIVPVGSAEFETIRMLLARHVGPIARVFVQKAGAEARTPDEFCEKLAAHLRSAADRAAFLKAARAVL